MSNLPITKTDIVKDYLEEKKFQGKFRNYAELEKIPIISNTVGQFLSFFCALKKPASILEIGCGIGYSSYFLLKNSPKANYIGIDLNKERAKIAKQKLKQLFPAKRIKILIGDAIKKVKELDCQADLVFIDGAKHEYPDYLKSLLGKVRRHGYIIADNVLYKNKVLSKKINAHDTNSVEGIREYIMLVSNKNNFKTYFFGIDDGISVSEVLI
ncbi:MAG: methyltransferase domain-containing protein [Candidatus Humimicrobiaceae bacterium]